MTSDEAKALESWISSFKPGTFSIIPPTRCADSDHWELRLVHYEWEGEPFASKLKDGRYWLLPIPATK